MEKGGEIPALFLFIARMDRHAVEAAAGVVRRFRLWVEVTEDCGYLHVRRLRAEGEEGVAEPDLHRTEDHRIRHGAVEAVAGYRCLCLGLGPAGYRREGIDVVAAVAHLPAVGVPDGWQPGSRAGCLQPGTGWRSAERARPTVRRAPLSGEEVALSLTYELLMVIPSILQRGC
jgi:hypothetical protein